MAKATTKGKRGRKHATDPKLNVQFYIESSVIKAVGGMPKARTICEKALWDYKYRKEMKDDEGNL